MAKFTDLPPEIRNQIYALAFTDYTDHNQSAGFRAAGGRMPPSAIHASLIGGPGIRLSTPSPAICQVSREIRHESMSLWRGSYIFTLQSKLGFGDEKVLSALKLQKELSLFKHIQEFIYEQQITVSAPRPSPEQSLLRVPRKKRGGKVAIVVHIVKDEFTVYVDPPPKAETRGILGPYRVCARRHVQEGAEEKLKIVVPVLEELLGRELRSKGVEHM